MAGIVSCQGATSDLHIYTGYEADGGTLVASFGVGTGSPLLALAHHEQLEQHIDELTGRYQLDASIHASMAFGRVLRVDYASGCHREWRVNKLDRARVRGGGKVAEFEAEAPHEVLRKRSGIITQPHTSGRKDPYPQLFLTPTEHIDFALRNSDAPSWVVRGTIDPTERLWISYERFNPWRLALEVAARAAERESVPYYVQFLRNGTTQYDLNIVADPAAAADTVDVTYGTNLLSLRESEPDEKFATRIYISTGGESAAELNLADNGFRGRVDCERDGNLQAGRFALWRRRSAKHQVPRDAERHDPHRGSRHDCPATSRLGERAGRSSRGGGSAAVRRGCGG